MCRLSAQIFMPAALHDAEKRLLLIRFSILPMCLERTFSPSMRTLHRLSLVLVRLRRRGAFVKGEKDIRAKRVLDLDRTFGRKAVKRTVKVRGEGNALVINDRELTMFTCNLFIKNSNGFFLRRIFFNKF